VTTSIFPLGTKNKGGIHRSKKKKKKKGGKKKKKKKKKKNIIIIINRSLIMTKEIIIKILISVKLPMK